MFSSKLRMIKIRNTDQIPKQTVIVMSEGIERPHYYICRQT